MSDAQFMPEPPALMSAVKARNIARAYKALAERFADAGDRPRARGAMENSQWWLTYSISLSQTPPGAVDEH